MSEQDDLPATSDPVPRLPRGKGLALSGAAMMRIGITAIALVALLVLQRPCSKAVGQFVTAFGSQPSSGSAAPAAGELAPAPGPAAAPAAPTPRPAGAPVSRDPADYEVLSPSMTDDELRSAIERARRRAAEAEAAEAAEAARRPATPAPAPAPPAPGAPSAAPQPPAR